MEEETKELPTSELGTKKYWDESYDNELDNFENSGDIGEVWFGTGPTKRIINWMGKNVSKDEAIIDLGCGNGDLLIRLRQEGFTKLTGVDYSESAIQLATEVSKTESIDDIRFITADILNGEGVLMDKFSVCLDKGTYDAVSLCPDDAAGKRIKYLDTVPNILIEKGIFIITSCNWTEEELKSHFCKRFEYVEAISHPQIRFSGKTGQTVSTAVFRLKD